LIKDDGTVVIPNTSENSLNINKGTFESGERVSIESKTTSTSGDTNFRNIIRGGTRIEPILTNQIGHSSASWASSISLTDLNQIGGVVSDFQGRVERSSLISTPTTFTELNFPTLISSGSNSGMTLTGPTYRFVISSGMINEGVSIILKANIKIQNTSSPSFESFSSAWARFKNFTTNTIIGEIRGVESPQAEYGFIKGGTTGEIKWQVSLPNDQLINGHSYGIEIISGHTYNNVLASSIFEVEQVPIPTSTAPTASLIQTAFPSPYIIISSSALVDFYGNSSVRQENISGSGFNSFSLPWSLQYGDEIRFEGDENKVWKIKEAFATSIFNISYIQIELDRPVSSSIDLSKFLFRRYVDDASLILLEGFKPIGSEGPFILKPEYCSPVLNKGIDQFILDLTQKGLL
jgi:hypothetical protein